MPLDTTIRRFSGSRLARLLLAALGLCCAGALYQEVGVFLDARRFRSADVGSKPDESG